MGMSRVFYGIFRSNHKTAEDMDIAVSHSSVTGQSPDKVREKVPIFRYRMPP